MNLKALTAEFVATLTLVFIGVGAIAADALTGAVGLTGIALAHGLAIAVMVAATAATSGGHINPAVTIGFLVTRRIDPVNAAGYIAAQCAGAFVGALAIKACYPADILAAIKMGTPNLAQGIAPGAGVITEFILTFLLMFVIVGAAVDKRGPNAAALFIGLTITADIFMGGPISGAAMNPARHLGPALAGGGMENFWVYWIGPVAGAVAAALVADRTLVEKT